MKAKVWLILFILPCSCVVFSQQRQIRFEHPGINDWLSQNNVFPLTILPPFYLTVWFQLIAGISLFAGMLFYRYRLRRIKAHNAMLEILVQERTHQLAQSINEERSAREDAERARAEAEQATKARNIFLATMSHEIRTPMNGVIAMASLLAQTTLNEEQRSYTETIQTCGENLLTVINDILDFSTIESGKLGLEEKEFDLHTCIEEVLAMFAPRAAEIGLDLVYQIECNVPYRISGDRTRLRQILINLVSNAIKFTHTGEVFVRVYGMKFNTDNTVQLGFEVRDTGIGIPEDKLERLFKAFSQVDSSTTRKYDGTGLGLVICEKLIRLMGGYIEVESKPGQGSVFAFTINTKKASRETGDETGVHMADIARKRVSVVDDHATNSHAPQVVVEKDTSPQNVLQAGFAKQYPLQLLLAEDNHFNQVVATAILGKLGYQFDIAENGEEVLQKMQEKTYDIILMDVQMPEMDGLEATRSIRETYTAQPPVIIAMTANAMQEDKEDCLRAGMNDYLSKPVNPDELVMLLKKWAVSFTIKI